MFGIFVKSVAGILFWVLVLGACFCQTGESVAPDAIEGVWDPARYISIDEIQPGMDAYCLTEYGRAGIEKFGMKVVDVVRNINPGGSASGGSRDTILVQGTDERFIHTGPVSGCSGSPVYIDGRLAGALAFGWLSSKDPLYGVTPIEEMLRAGEASYSGQRQEQMGFVFDYSAPIDFAEIYRQIRVPRFSSSGLLHRMPYNGITERNNSIAGATTLPCPLITSGLPAEVCADFAASVKPFGFMAVSGAGAGGAEKLQDPRPKTIELVPGACLAVPLVTGDITMTVIGTVTEVVDGKVYGFGHGFLGYGSIDLPMATGRVHTVVSSIIRSFKFASAVEIVGALTMDESTAVCGQIGAKAQMFPLTINVDRYGEDERVYNCQVANNRLLTPRVLHLAMAGAALMSGGLPPDHTIEYKVTIGMEDAESVTFENVSTGIGLSEMLMESVGSVAMLLNNPYKKVRIKSVALDIRIVPKSIASHIWSVDLSDSKVRPGEVIDVSIVVESFLAGKKRYLYSLKIPLELAPGRYDLLVCGPYEYRQFLRKMMPYKFIGQSLPSLLDALNDILAIRRDKLYCLLVLPPGGVTVERAELPDLPATKALVMQDAKRMLRIQPYPRWLENDLETGTVVIDKKVFQITVEN